MKVFDFAGLVFMWLLVGYMVGKARRAYSSGAVTGRELAPAIILVVLAVLITGVTAVILILQAGGNIA